VCLAPFALAGTAHAQRVAGCFPDAPVPGWSATDLGLSTPGSAAPDGKTGYLLCSDGAGYGAADGLRTLDQLVDDDFTLDAQIADVDEGGLGGLETRAVLRDPTSARLYVAVERDAEGAWLVAGVRSGGETDEAAPLAVALPVSLRLRRAGGLLTAEWSPDGAQYFEALSFDTAATPLAGTPLAAGLAQAAPGAAAPRVARFGAVHLAAFTPPPDAECTQVDVSPDGALITLSGGHLAGVAGVRVAGEDAEVLARGDARLQVRVARPAAAVASGAIVLAGPGGETVVGGKVAWAGRPFVRGDVNEDGAVDDLDPKQLSGLLDGSLPWIRCEAAADVDDDGDIDLDDLGRLKGFLVGRAEPPPAPFPAPGFPSGPALACGLGDPPVAQSLYGRDGKPLPTGATLREGDVVELRGSRLPVGPGVSMYFGDVKMEALPGATQKAVRLRVGAVPTTGEKCPGLFESSDTDPTLTSRFGLLRAVRPDTPARRLCPRFERSRQVAGTARWDADRGELHVQVPRAAVDPALGVQVDLILARPAMTGTPDRGAREISVRARAADPTRGYDSLLESLAAKVDRALDGGAPPDACRQRDFVAEANPGADELVIRPFGGPLPPEPPPPPPPHVDTLAPYVPPLSGGHGTVLPLQPTCADDDPDAPDTRLSAWCQFVAATGTGSSGLPRWESSVPQSALTQHPSALNDLPAPADRPVDDKHIMYGVDAWSDAIDGGYFSPCAQAARVAYCVGGQQDWMPPFMTGSRIYKGFWRPYAKLPASVDPNDLYSYQPPDGPRQYLVGLHIAAGKAQISTYWKWATFWLPRGNDTTTKDGHPIGETYNPSCTTGSFEGMPQEVQGVWRHYAMCVNDENGGTACGNPWGPTDECLQDTCRNCHLQNAIDFPGVTPTGELSTAWMVTLTRPDPVKSCFAEIQAGLAHNQKPYFNLTPPECLP
jgi:hypothetical protein